MPRILPVLVAWALLAAMSGGAPPASVSATAPPDVAGLVISYGDGAYSYATVPLDGEQIDGVALLERSGLTVLAIGFGGYGQGVCKIEVVGCDVSACRTRLCQTADSNSPFWRYLLVGDSGWVMSPLGASGVKVEAGQIYGWAWAGGQGLPADVPFLSLDDVMARSGFDPDASPLQASVRSVGLAMPAAASPSTAAYAGAGIILLAVGVGGVLLVRRTASRTRMHLG
ncbi:MAG: hypothetical protein QM589_04960 [Thermomicrobiales bacterium]